MGLTALDTATVSDALDRLGLAGQALGVRPLDPAMRVSGPAFTVAMLPVGADGGTVGDYIDEVPEGAVVVIDARGRSDATVWGDLLTTAARRRGVAGTVVDGVCRDSARSRELGYPLFARGTAMRTGKARLQMMATRVPVALGRILVRPGDWILGDADGVVVVPADRRSRVETVAARIAAAEDRIRRAVENGERLVDARRSGGYHDLQSAR